MLKLACQIKSWNTKILGTRIEKACLGGFDRFMADVEARARLNVSPGRGPGPHPHVTEHEDTGDLAAGIHRETKVTPQGPSSAVTFEQIYGLYLEIGWTAPSGRFYRYPWLMPAFQGNFPRVNLYLGRFAFGT